MPRYQWSKLNRQQVGTYAEYFVKMEFTMYGFEVYDSEVDDRGIDFIARKRPSPYIEVQVKSVRAFSYVFMHKEKFPLNPDRFLALALMFEEKPPELFLVPATTWETPNSVFVGRDYEGLKSRPEWGVNLSKKSLSVLNPFAFDSMAKSLEAQLTPNRH